MTVVPFFVYTTKKGTRTTKTYPESVSCYIPLEYPAIKSFPVLYLINRFLCSVGPSLGSWAERFYESE